MWSLKESFKCSQDHFVYELLLWLRYYGDDIDALMVTSNRSTYNVFERQSVDRKHIVVAFCVMWLSG